MKFLIFGDIFGRIGRNAVKKEFQQIKNKYKPDFILANIENISSGRGPVEKHLIEMENLGVDIMTGGDHIFDNLRNIKSYLEKEDCILLRPANFYETIDFPLAGIGYKIIKKDGVKILIIHLLGQVFIKHNVYNPFLKIKELLEELKGKYNISVIDFHKEATAEIYGMGLYLSNDLKEYNTSLIFGTHSHIQTNDEMIFENGTGFICDVGMSGPINSVIGADFSSLKKRFINGIGQGKIEQCLDKKYVINAIFTDINEKTGKCESIEKIRIKGEL